MFRKIGLRRTTLPRIGILTVALLATCVTTAIACNIPVFRYALERWKPDASEVIVFFDQKLTADEETLVTGLESQTNSGHVNAKIIRIHVGEDQDATRRELWQELNRQPGVSLPHVLVRTKLGQSRFINHWHGSLSSVPEAGIFQSPARAAIRERLLAGHSVVWLLVGSDDAEKTEKARKLAEGTFATLDKKIRLPEGIGLPGSELYAEVPLVLKFSLIEIRANDPQEAFLVNLLTGFRKQAYSEGEPLLVPVFGRGRALEVIPADNASTGLIEDLTTYLSGACSCQVKEQNPGFDLLIAADWEGELFGDEANLPPDRSAEEGQNRGPVLLDIPTGRKK